MSKRIVTLCVLLPVVALLSSCSVICSFVIVNKSDAPLEVQYKLREDKTAIQPYRLSSIPAKKSLKDLEDGDAIWREMSGEEHTFDATAGLVTLTLQPGEALRVHETINYSHLSAYDAETFPITGLRLSGAKGTLQFVGEQARLQLNTDSGSLYTVTYY